MPDRIKWGQAPILGFAGPVGANNTYNLALFNRETDVIQRLERGALFNRLASEPPPLVELVFPDDVVDFDDAHSG